MPQHLSRDDRDNNEGPNYLVELCCMYNADDKTKILETLSSYDREIETSSNVI